MVYVFIFYRVNRYKSSRYYIGEIKSLMKEWHSTPVCCAYTAPVMARPCKLLNLRKRLTFEETSCSNKQTDKRLIYANKRRNSESSAHSLHLSNIAIYTAYYTALTFHVPVIYGINTKLFFIHDLTGQLLFARIYCRYVRQCVNTGVFQIAPPINYKM